MIRARVREPALIVVGSDDTARECAEIATPVKVVRAKRVDTVIERARRLRPLAIVVDEEVSPLAAERIAREIPAPVVTTRRGDGDLQEQLAPVLRFRR
jgi:hypothetical protein